MVPILFSVAPAEAGAQSRKRSAWPPLGARFRGHDDDCMAGIICQNWTTSKARRLAPLPPFRIASVQCREVGSRYRACFPGTLQDIPSQR
jgi:hypothetical protein